MCSIPKLVVSLFPCPARSKPGSKILDRSQIARCGLFPPTCSRSIPHVMLNMNSTQLFAR